MNWTLGEEIEIHEPRLDRPPIRIPWYQVDSVPLSDWVKENPQTLKGGGPIAIIDAETWRDFDKPVMFGMVIFDREGGQEKYPCGGEYGPNGEIIPTPEKWSWDRCEKHKDSHKREPLENCPDCVRVKPASFGTPSTRTNLSKRKQRITRCWCWADELETHFIPLLMERQVNVIYAHNGTVDLIAFLSQVEADAYHPLQLFVQDDPKEFSKLLFKGSTVLQAQLDFATYFNRQNETEYARRVYDMKLGRSVIKKDYPVKWIDSLGVLPLRLAAIGEAVGYPKGHTPEKFTNFDHPDFGNVMKIVDEDIRYCIQDCEVLFHGLNQFFQMAKSLGYRGDVMPLTSGTLGSQMIATANIESGSKPVLYRKKKGSKWKYQTIVNEPDLDDVCRFSMYGGRTQAFKTNPHLDYWAKWDANAFYPSQMVPSAERRFPDFRHQQGVKNPSELTPEIFDSMEGCAYVKWTRPDSDLVGLLPGRNEDRKLDWTLSEFTGWVTFPEIRRARELGYQIELKNCPNTGYAGVVMATLPYNPFECLQAWYDERLRMKQADDPREFAVKILLNSGGFGKFVERNRSRIITTEEAWVRMDPEWEFSKVIGNEAIVYGYAESNFERADTTANIMGAYITAYARIELHRVLTEIGFENLLYCDTDSAVFTTGERLSLEGSKLGEWKLEQVGDYWWSAAPKQYKYHQTWDEDNGDCLKWNARIKGCSLRNAANHAGIDYNQFCEEIDLDGTVTFERVLSIKESWRKPDETMTAGKWIVETKDIGRRGK